MSTWYCNKCNTPVTTVTGEEGTSYFHCPTCDKAVDAYPDDLAKDYGIPKNRVKQATKEVITEHEEALRALEDKNLHIEIKETFIRIDPEIKKQLDRIEAAVAALLPPAKPRPAKDTAAKSDPN